VLKHLLLCAAVTLVASTSGLHAQGRHAVSTLSPPYACVQLNFPPGYLYEHPNVEVPVRAEPSMSARVLYTAPQVMVARWPQQAKNGFIQIVHTMETDGWVEARYIAPWSNPYAPAARCVPAIMSDGSVGTGG